MHYSTKCRISCSSNEQGRRLGIRHIFVLSEVAKEEMSKSGKFSFFDGGCSMIRRVVSLLAGLHSIQFP